MDFQSFVQEVSSQIKDPTPVMDLPAMQAQSRQGQAGHSHDDTRQSATASPALSKEALFEQSLSVLTSESTLQMEQAEQEVHSIEQDLEAIEDKMHMLGGHIESLKAQVLELEELYNKRKNSLFTARYLVEDAKKGYDTKAALLREAFGMN